MKQFTGTFFTEDIFYITGRGWVLTGELNGNVRPGQLLAFKNGIILPIKAVSTINTLSSTSKIGLLVSTIFASRQEFIDQSIIGFLAQIMD